MSWKFPAQCIWQFSQQGCPTGGVTTEDKQIINFTEGHAQLVFLHCSITQFLTIYHTITVRSEIIMPQTFAIILFLKSFKILLLFPNPLLLFSHYSLWSLLELVLQLSAIFITWSKLEVYLHNTPHFHMERLANILNSLPLLSFSELFQHNYLRPNHSVPFLTI